MLSTAANRWFLSQLGNLPGNYLEIGVYDGENLASLSRRFPQKLHFGIDPFIEDGNTSHATGHAKDEPMPDVRQKAINSISGLANVKLFEERSDDFFRRISKDSIKEMDIGVVFVDGSHHYPDVCNDLLLAKRLLSNGGIIVWDDGSVVDVSKGLQQFEITWGDSIVSKQMIEGDLGFYKVAREKKPAVVYTFVSDDWYFPCGTPVFINSFKRFHPDIPIVVFRQRTVERIFKEHEVGWATAKASFALELVHEYELVVNMDADHVVTDRMEAVFDRHYDVGCPWNWNNYMRAGYGPVRADQYVQGGMVASRVPRFWRQYEFHAKAHWKYNGPEANENNSLNMIWYFDPEISSMNRVIFDKDRDYYGCKSLACEPDFEIVDGRLTCHGEKVCCYHHAKGGPAMPKLIFDNMPFKPEVKAWLKDISSGDHTNKSIEL